MQPYWLIVAGTLVAALVSADGAPQPPQTLPGWRLELVAEHPVIKAPAVVCTAPDGRIFVGEDPMDVSTERADEKKGRIVCLLPGGRATTFADGLYAPFGMQYLEGKLYVLHNPKLSVFTDGGDRALDRTDLIEQTLPEPWVSNWNDHVPSNFRLAMDGYFYFSIGDKGLYGMVGRDGRRIDLRGGGVLRMRPDGTGAEIFATGTRNTLDIAISPEDELFTYDNTDEHDWMGRFTHMVDGGVYGYPYDFVPRRPYTLWKLADYGPGAACGALSYNDDAWPAEFHGNVFIADHVQRNVRRVVLARDGATFREVTNQNIFIEPASDFRPVGLHETHDGTGLLITDWVNGGYKEKVDVGRLWRLTRLDGTNAAPVPDWYAPAAMGKKTDATVEQLLTGLAHPRRAVRLTAQRALAHQFTDSNSQSSILNSLTGILTNSTASEPSRWHALWALDAIDGGVSARKEILKLASGEIGQSPPASPLGIAGSGFAGIPASASHVRQAVRQLGERRVAEAAGIANGQLGSSNASIRFRAAVALRRIGDPPGAFMFEALTESNLFVRFAAITAMNSLARQHPDLWQSFVDALEPRDPDNAHFREAIALVFRETYDEALVQALAAFAADTSRASGARAQALRLLAPIHRRVPAWTGKWWGTHPALAKPPARTVDWAGTPLIYNALVAGVNDSDAGVRVAAIEGLRGTGDTNALPSLRRRFANETNHSAKRALIEAFGALRDPEAGALLTRLLAGPDDNVPGATLLPAILAAANSLGATWSESGALHSPAAVALAKEIEKLLVTNQSLLVSAATNNLTSAALEALGQFRRSESAAAFAQFARSKDERERNAAIAGLTKLGAKTAWPHLEPLLTNAAPDVRRGAVKSVGTLKIRAAVPLLLAARTNDETRAEALAALVQTPDLRALDAYLDGFSAAGWALREPSAKAIRAIASEALPLLEARADTLSASALAELSKIYEKDAAARRGPLFARKQDMLPPEDYANYALAHKGDPQRGKALFFDVSGVACIRCHAVGGEGGRVGPDLTLAGKAFPRDVLIESILYPNKAVREGYAQVNIETKDGEEFTGAVKAETAEQVTMLTLDNRTVQIPTARIADRHTTVTSMMPEGLQVALTLEQFADLVAYCQSLKTDPRAPATDSSPGSELRAGEIRENGKACEDVSQSTPLEQLRPVPPSQRVPDEVYLQEIGWQIKSSDVLTSVAAFDDQVFAGTAKGLVRVKSEKLIDDPSLVEPVQRLIVANDRLWAIMSAGLHRWETNGWRKLTGETVADLTTHRGEVVAAGGRRLWRIRGNVVELATTNQAPFGIVRLSSHNESVAVLGAGRLTFFHRGRFGGLDVYGFPTDHGWDWGELPSPQTRDLLSAGAPLWIATDRGLGVLRGMSLTSVRGEQGLPAEDVTCLARGFTNDLWIGTTRGAIRHVGGEFQYFAGQRWLPGDSVRAVAVAGRKVYIATEGGLGVIRYEPYTLAKKAAYYEAHLDAWGQKRLGFTHKLEWDDGLKEFVREVSDNDGGYTGDYLAAQSYRWAVTRDPAARREATNTFHALRWLEAMTGIPGFPARSAWVKGERGHKAAHGSGGYAAEWHDTADGRFEWKGDTSSDEICSHFYAISVFLELVAEGAEVEQGKRHLARIATHLIDHGWKLIDLDGNPTRWGRWDPEYFRTDEGRFDRGLQALEILSFMKTAAHFTGDAKFSAAYQNLVDLGYPDYTLRQRNTFPPDEVLHFEDQLAFWCWWTLLRYETDPELRALYRRGLERSFEVVRVEHNPWFNFVYGVLTGNDCEPAASVAHLREWPLDLRVWSYRNSQRADLRTPLGYVALKGGTKAFSPREHEPMRWDAWTMKLDGGTGGRDVVEPSGWLVAYWMGRYYGYIGAPSEADSASLKVAPEEVPPGGARPYDGPTHSTVH